MGFVLSSFVALLDIGLFALAFDSDHIIEVKFIFCPHPVIASILVES